MRAVHGICPSSSFVKAIRAGESCLDALGDFLEAVVLVQALPKRARSEDAARRRAEKQKGKRGASKQRDKSSGRTGDTPAVADYVWTSGQNRRSWNSYTPQSRDWDGTWDRRSWSAEPAWNSTRGDAEQSWNSSTSLSSNPQSRAWRRGGWI